MEFIIVLSCWLVIGFILGYGVFFYLDFIKEKKKEKENISFEKTKIANQNYIRDKEKYDVVYILKNDIDDYCEELRYSLRSLKNFEYNNVWFVGGQPKDLVPDKSLYIKQEGKNKWEKVVYTLKEICMNNEISENFWLFNDDFFVMKQHEQYPAYYDEELAFQILRLEDERGKIEYSSHLRQCLLFLKKHKLPTKNYALHVPMLINKTKALELLNKFPDINNFRNLYGNYVKLPAKQIGDVKYSDNSRPINTNSVFLSSCEKSFLNGLIGEYIRSQFPNPSRFEK